MIVLKKNSSKTSWHLIKSYCSLSPYPLILSLVLPTVFFKRTHTHTRLASHPLSSYDNKRLQHHQVWSFSGCFDRLQVFYNNINPTDQPQEEQAVEQQAELCPPVPAVLPEGSCDLPTCSSDRMCGADGDRRKCCYNGCIYTCLPELRPPPCKTRVLLSVSVL